MRHLYTEHAEKHHHSKPAYALGRIAEQELRRRVQRRVHVAAAKLPLHQLQALQTASNSRVGAWPSKLGGRSCPTHEMEMSTASWSWSTWKFSDANLCVAHEGMNSFGSSPVHSMPSTPQRL
mmetsp:Transcript_98692/g.299505  ORF Transcript_98692/g.299505 Transcript_98692/m.299505 type:complete len:122 (+) Transcript_98692:269-634(+)